MGDFNHKCLLCGAESVLSGCTRGYFEPDIFNIYHCPSCGSAYSSPRVDTSAIYNQIYNLGKELHGYHRYYFYKEAVKKKKHPLQFLVQQEETYWGAITALQELTFKKNDAKILEVGCGMGFLSYALIREGYDATGLDISQNAVNQAISTYGNHYVCADLKDFSKTQKDFDVIILTEVIEHIKNPVDFLQTALGMLKPEGALIVTTPNKSIYSDKVVWFTDLPPVHCWWFSEKSLEYIANRIDANIHFIDFTDFYRTKTTYFVVDEQLSLPHFFNSDGKINYKISRKDKIRCKLLSVIPSFVVTSYRKIKYRSRKNLYKGGKRGNVICAIFKPQIE
jgi:SAM-dependent methyltransferase